jgi:hypothetical protein
MDGGDDYSGAFDDDLGDSLPPSSSSSVPGGPSISTAQQQHGGNGNGAEMSHDGIAGVSSIDHDGNGNSTRDGGGNDSVTMEGSIQLGGAWLDALRYHNDVMEQKAIPRPPPGTRYSYATPIMFMTIGRLLIACLITLLLLLADRA